MRETTVAVKHRDDQKRASNTCGAHGACDRVSRLSGTFGKGLQNNVR